MASAFGLGLRFIYKMLKVRYHQSLAVTDLSNHKFPHGCTVKQYAISNFAKPQGHIIALHGLNTGGGQDDRMIHLAKIMASLGFVIYVPNIPRVADHIIDHDVSQQVEDILVAIGDLCANQYGVFGPSYLGSVALDVAAREPCRSQIQAICTLGSFYQMRAFLDFIVDSDSVDLYAVTILLKNMIIQNGYWHDSFQNIFEQIFKNFKTCQPIFKDAPLHTLTKTEIGFLSSIVDKNKLQEYFHGSQLPFQSPKLQIPHSLSAVNCPVSIIHGSQDRVIPASHADRMFHYFKHMDVKLAITPVISHSDYSLRLRDIPSIINVIMAFGLFFKSVTP